MPPTRQIAAIAFDLDGLMVNTEDVYCDVGSQLCRRRGKLFEDELRNTMMGQPAAKALQVMIEYHGLTDTVDDLIAESEELFWEVAANRLEPMPGLFDLLEHVESAQLPKCVATSGARRYAGELLSRVGIEDRFAFVLTADDVTNGKPHPEIYHLAADTHGVPAGAMLVLEDSANGCRAAVAAGAITIAVPSEHSAEHSFEGAELVANSLADSRIRELLVA